jgi:16S rRNA (guanine966-N2)-methyltransferase
MRVTGGRLRGRPLRVPGGRAVRPSSDRVREALFARLGSLEEAHVLDLYAGSGALGIEALSRGAGRAVFAERARTVAAVLRSNLETLDLRERTRVVKADASAAVRRLAAEGLTFDLVFLDPPYESGEALRALRAIADSGILAPGAMVVVETGRHHPLAAPPALVVIDERRYGDTILTRLAPTASGRESAMGGPIAP